MGNLQNPKIIYFMGFLFLATGCIAVILLLIDTPTLRCLLLLALCVWSFCRFYYFAFYVIQHYVDDQFRFTGLGDFLRYAVNRRPPGHS